MRNGLRIYLALLVTLVVCGVPVFGQTSSTGSISGSVLDPKGAVVPGATVKVVSNATGQEFTVQTTGDGSFTVPSLLAGVYTATITATGFKQSVVTDIKVDVGKPSSVNVQLEIGAANEIVTVVGGGELLQTQTATIGTTLTGRQITDLPTASRDALDLVLAMPGTTTPGRPRTSSINGLPKGSLNISLDGVNVQDNTLKSSDGFFTYIRPRTDAIAEVTTSTATPGAESSGEGAFQIKFVTQGGSNEYHGGGYWYYRTPGLNANYWFNNRDLAPDPATGKAPRTPIILNQPGFKIGGPISIPKLFNGKERAFFFFNYEEFRLPESTLRTRNILTTQAQSGIYRFFSSSFNPAGTPVTCTGSGSSRLCSLNVFDVASSASLTFANADPTVSSLLGQIRGSLAGAAIRTSGDPNVDQSTFVNNGFQLRRFPTVRLDFNASKNHHIENIWNYQSFGSTVDFLNSRDPQFPGFPNHGSQTSIRFSNVTAWRWTISNNLVNEARYGITGGTVLFFGEVNAGQFENQGGFNLSLGNFSSGGFGLTSATNTTAPSRRNAPVREFTDSLNWIKGNHTLNFGMSLTRVGFWSNDYTVVPTAVFSTSSTLDPAPVNAFSFLPATQQGGAAQLYALLAGRLTSITANARLDENTNKYSYLGSQILRAKELEWGTFAQDTWRLRPNLTLNLGLRYERNESFEAENNNFAGVSFEGLFGESGAGNLFKPGTLAGQRSAYTAFPPGTKAFNPSGLFLPSVGFAYTPNFKSGVLRWLGGESGQTVIRGGFSVASVREGMNVFLAVTGSNPGGTIAANRSLTLGNLPVGTYLRQGPFAPPATCSSPGTPIGCIPDAPVYPNFGLITDSVNAFDPNLKMGFVRSWSFGIQRELTKDNVVEIRYVGNRGHDLWRQVDLNELNVVENGVAAEWQLAQQNLLANIAAGRGLNFRYFGPGTGTSPLPITLGYFQGRTITIGGVATPIDPNNPAHYTNGNFASATFFNTMNPLDPRPISFGSLLASTSFDSRRTPLGQPCFGIAGCVGTGQFPLNHFFVNPTKRGDPFLVDNSGNSTYDAVQVEFRRRMARGLLLQANYTFGKSLSNMFASSSSVFDQPNTLRDPDIKKGPTPFDITQALKLNFIWEVPVGQGRTFMGGASKLTDMLVGGWGFNGNIRIQSGSPFFFNAPVSIGPGIQNAGNFQLVGMSLKELQKAVGVYRDPDGFVYVLPKDIRDNTIKAFNVAMTTSGPAYTQGAPTGRFIAPAGFGNCVEAIHGDCGFANMVLKGPSFFRSDLSLVKKFRFTETVNVEMRLEMLNAFNNINFLVGAAGNDVNSVGNLTSSAFARMTAAYQDLSTTNDPGGRVGQLVLRINF
ncbi:MAG TPA: TonB-dependent receptor [Pyrinomonadaceae bacterium]|nr:TonB-dependent receptor [Pyrinomonadaceae bacterium]